MQMKGWARSHPLKNINKKGKGKKKIYTYIFGCLNNITCPRMK